MSLAAAFTATSFDTARGDDTGTTSASPSVVEAQTTQTEQVTDNHDGTFTLTAAREPVRAHTITGWQPLDLTLHRDADGRITPAVAANPVSFNGGSSGPAATFSTGDATVSFTLPTTLPAPTLDGPTAVYTDVYPDVDLQLTATPTGFTDTLVIHTAQAATNPAVTNPQWTVTTAGITLDAHSDGTLSTVSGDQTISTDQPTLWDSSTADSGPTPTAADIGTGQASSIATTIADTASASNATQRSGTTDSATTSPSGDQTTVILNPTPAQLTGPDVHYPVYIDPGMSATKQHTLTVSSGGVHAYDSSSRNLQTGWCNWDYCGTLGVARSFFSLNTTALTGKPTTAKIFSASVSVQQLASGASAATPVDLWSTNGFSSATTWPGPTKKTKLDTVSSAAGFGTNDPEWLKFSGSAVTSLFQSSADSDTTSTTFGLIAPNEGDAFEWKQFARDPVATITYGFPPATPSNLHITPAVTCSGHYPYATSTTPIMYATTTSYNPSATTGLGMRFQLDIGTSGVFSAFKETKTPVAGSTSTSAQTVQWNSYSGNTTNTAALPSNESHGYHLKAQAVSSKDGTVSSPWSATLSFVYDAWPPSQPTFTVNTDGSLSVHTTSAAGIMWSTTEQGLPTLGSTRCSYNAVLSHDANGNPTSGYLPVTNDTATVPATVGLNRIYIKAFDDAHNLTAVTIFDPTP
ncbi:MAG TPA: hypothetical protein VG502_11090 [Flexivirga sp.]|uniref:hypothetical protein n=1 Tax=Flexivirga sp. TaxID=1962927 RepID=UPI002C43E4C9|nr:hypothetical protein [Flexivirga sp.]HWC22834.1 hypothetical protein [Flexivirga sp.]